MARDDDEKTLGREDITPSIAKIWRMVAGAALPEDGQEDRWAESFEAAVAMAIVRIGKGDDEIGVSVNDLATMMSRAFCRSEDKESLPLASMPVRARVAWQAAARHVVNLLLVDEADRQMVGEHEKKILAWAANELARLM